MAHMRRLVALARPSNATGNLTVERVEEKELHKEAEESYLAVNGDG